MKKATQRAAPISLGTKRSCPECSTKIYDLNRSELTCPKCERTFTPDEAPATAPLPMLKRPKSVEKAEGELAAQTDVLASDEPLETVEDAVELDGDDDDVVEDLSVEDEDKED